MCAGFCLLQIKTPGYKSLYIERTHNGADPVINLFFFVVFFSGSQSETFLVSKTDPTLILEATCESENAFLFPLKINYR